MSMANIRTSGSTPQTPQGRLSEKAPDEQLAGQFSNFSIGNDSPSRKGKVGRLRSKQLKFSDSPQARARAMPEWSNEELQNVVQYILLYSDGTSWPAHKDMRFWDGAAKFIYTKGYTTHQRSGIHQYIHDVHAFYNDCTNRECLQNKSYLLPKKTV